MKRSALLALASSVVSLALSAEPSLVLAFGKVFTGDPAKPWAQAIAIDGNKIAAVGTNEEIMAMAGARTRVIDLAQRTVIPGINDAHMHPGPEGEAFGIDVGIDPTWDDLSAAIRGAADETPADTWIDAVIGPQILLDEHVNAATIEKLAPKRKVRLTTFTGHGMIFSETAMRALGLVPVPADPEGGWFGRDREHRDDGRSFEYAEYALRRRIADASSDADFLDDARTLSGEALRYGITSLQAMPTVNEKRFAAALQQSGTPVRVRIMRMLGDDKEWGAVKYILDGTPIERNAALRTKYAAGGEGRLTFDDKTVARFARDAAESHKQILFHTAGDRAVEQALRAFAQFPALERPRLEHGDGLQRDLFPLAKKTGAVVVQNPAHFPFRDTYPAGDYFLVASLIRAGIPLALGSDGLLNPYLNILLATDNGPESLTREEAVSAYTRGSAYAEMKEREKGTLAPGMLADVAVLSQDIFTVPAPALPDTASVMTIIDGKIVYEANR
ncbi:MAG TPA: amidohydrolase family protein [Thermoanaerobaculia bacterium]|nr:amidohydrolase family protein [Thermoanaerobaculia bacterium]